ncbi:hypothetical protein, partial [Marinoscillum furvescens]
SASFMQVFTDNTLAAQLVLPLIGRTEDLSLFFFKKKLTSKYLRPAGRTQKKSSYIFMQLLLSRVEDRGRWDRPFGR